jgi:antitoxin (DNA-binding transcriptional repressor) of toxin-antitoxin stability system
VKKARIAQLKDQLSRYLDHVRSGETVLVFDRDRPIARLVPLARAPAEAGVDEGRLDRLERAGLIRRGTGGLPEWLGKRKPPRLRGSVLKDLLAERKANW